MHMSGMKFSTFSGDKVENPESHTIRKNTDRDIRLTMYPHLCYTEKNANRKKCRVVGEYGVNAASFPQFQQKQWKTKAPQIPAQ
jgi:hypothetical protein